MDEANSGYDFKCAYIDRCMYYNRIYGAPPGVHLREAGASAMSDFIEIARQQLNLKPTDKI